MSPTATIARRRWAVVTTKIASGVDVVFSVVTTEAEAERVVEQLRAIGCKARAESAARGDVPGLQRRGRN